MWVRVKDCATEVLSRQFFPFIFRRLRNINFQITGPVAINSSTEQDSNNFHCRMEAYSLTIFNKSDQYSEKCMLVLLWYTTQKFKVYLRNFWQTACNVMRIIVLGALCSHLIVYHHHDSRDLYSPQQEKPQKFLPTKGWFFFVLTPISATKNKVCRSFFI